MVFNSLFYGMFKEEITEGRKAWIGQGLGLLLIQ